MATCNSGVLRGPVGLAVLVLTVVAIVVLGASALFMGKGRTMRRLRNGCLVFGLMLVLAAIGTAAIGRYVQVEDEDSQA